MDTFVKLLFFSFIMLYSPSILATKTKKRKIDKEPEKQLVAARLPAQDLYASPEHDQMKQISDTLKFCIQNPIEDWKQRVGLFDHFEIKEIISALKALHFFNPSSYFFGADSKKEKELRKAGIIERLQKYFFRTYNSEFPLYRNEKFLESTINDLCSDKNLEKGYKIFDLSFIVDQNLLSILEETKKAYVAFSTNLEKEKIDLFEYPDHIAEAERLILVAQSNEEASSSENLEKIANEFLKHNGFSNTSSMPADLETACLHAQREIKINNYKKYFKWLAHDLIIGRISVEYVLSTDDKEFLDDIFGDESEFIQDGF